MTFEPIWSGIIACYLFLGGLGGGFVLRLLVLLAALPVTMTVAWTL